jgi:hypothetical protein
MASEQCGCAQFCSERPSAIDFPQCPIVDKNEEDMALGIVGNALRAEVKSTTIR